MATDDDNDRNKTVKAPFDSTRMRDLVLDHVLDNAAIFLPGDGNEVEAFVTLMDSLEKMATKIALEAMANRMNLSALPTFSGTISPNQSHDVTDDRLFETRFRIVEQVGDNDPFKDEILSKEDADESYGTDFVNTYWGSLGEKCPNKVQTGDRTLWFSIVRYPRPDMTQSQDASVSNKIGYRAPSLG